MLFSISIQDDKSGSPLKIKFLGQSRIERNLKRNQVLLNKFNDFGIRVRNCTQLIAADSMGIEEIEKNGPIFGAGTGQC